MVYSVTTKFMQSVHGSGKRKTVADVYYSDSVTPLATNIPVVSGTLTIDRTSDIRRSGSIVVADRDLVLADFLPSGIELRIRSGFEYSTGSRELVPCGVFRVEDCFYNDGAQQMVTMDFFDRGQAIADYKPLEYKNAADLTYDAVIRGMMTDTYVDTVASPTLIVDPSFDVTQKFPGGATLDTSALEVIKKVVIAMGAEQYFNLDGNLVVGIIPVITGKTEKDAVWTIDVGESGVLIEGTRKISRKDTFNGVAVYGPAAEDNPVTSYIDESVTDSIHSILYDDADPNSSTYYNGKFGRRTLRIQNDLIVSQVAADKATYEMLHNFKGLAKSVTFKSLWNPATDVGDIVVFKFMDGSKELHLIDSLGFDFASGEMTGVTRSVELAEGASIS